MTELEQKQRALREATGYVDEARGCLAHYDACLIETVQLLGSAGFSEVAIAQVVNNMLGGSAQLRSITASFSAILSDCAGDE